MTQEKDGVKCFECGGCADCNHHVVPRSLGGTKTVPLCHKCHDLVHHGRPVRSTSVSELTKAALKKLKDEGVRLGRPRATAKRRYAKMLRNKGWTLKKIGEQLAQKEGRDKPYTPAAVSNLLK